MAVPGFKETFVMQVKPAAQFEEDHVSRIESVW